ncbi:hypothetical protein J4E89_002366 [Alternaria sp. Ai002NY15]|nr:hypothetical protein J4E89_002366 [Alternaria sp. Ai002NY15]
MAIAVIRSELWNFLRSMLSGFEDLDRIVVTGSSRGKAMERKLPWSPVHFVGGDDVGTHDLLTRMNKCVTKTGSDNAVKWQRQNGRLQLEVTSKPGLHESVAAQGVRALHNENSAESLPPSGECSFFACENRHSYGTEPVDKELNPNAAE